MPGRSDPIGGTAALSVYHRGQQSSMVWFAPRRDRRDHRPVRTRGPDAAPTVA